MLCETEKSVIPSSEPYIHIVHIFAASPDRLFDAWFQPHILRRWMSFTETGETEDVVANYRVGGMFWMRERDGATVRDRYGEYHSIERPHRLVFSLNVPEYFAGTTCVNISIAPSLNGSVMSFIQTGVHKDAAEAIWRKMFDRLTATLRASSDSATQTAKEKP